MRMRRLGTFVAAVAAMAVGGTLIAGASLLTDGNGPAGTEGAYQFTIGKGGSVGDFEANNGGVVRCPGNTEVAKYEDGELGDGMFKVGDGYVVISNYDGKSFDWAIADGSLNTIDANTIIVKGGPASEVYVYPSAANGSNYADFDKGLTAPENPKNGKLYGISHISFCFDPKA